MIPNLGAEGPKRSNPNAPANAGSGPGGWREALLPQFQQQPTAQAPSGNYGTSPDGTFVFNATSTQATGLMGAEGQALADIYFYQQPIAAYRPGSRFVGIGTLEQRSSGSHLGALGKATTIGEALAAYWDDPESRAAIVSASREHYKDYPNWNEQWAEGFWKEIVNVAAATGLNPGTIIDRINTGEMTLNSGATASSASSGGGGYGGGGGGGGGGSVALTNPTTARGLLMQTMQSVLGRNPTDVEYKDFLDTLKQTEMANPRTVSVEGDVAVQSGGTDPGMIAVEFAQAADDYKATQANKFYNAFMGALGGGVSG